MELITNSIAALGSLAMLVHPGVAPPAPVTAAKSLEAVEATTLGGGWGGWREAAAGRGWDFTVQYIGEGAANVSGGLRRGAGYNGLLNLAADLNLATAAGWSGAQLHGCFLLPHGRSLTERYVGDLFTLSNLDARDTGHLFEFWLEQHFAAETVSVRLGQMAVDQEFGFTDQGALFANATFGWFAIAGNNVIAPVYPQGAPGARLKWQARESVYVQFAVTDGDVNPRNHAGRETNPHGVKVRLDEGAFVIGEVGWNWTAGATARAGILKMGGWFHTAETAHLRRDENGLSLADPLSSGVAAGRDQNWGLYLAAEQQLWREHPDDSESAEGWGIFGRAGITPDDRNPISHYLELGATRTGWLPGRDEDVCGVAVAWGGISRELRGLTRDDNTFNANSAALPDYEIVLEVDYQAKVLPGFAVQPGVQYLIHPGGTPATDDALVFTLRAILDF